jgi:arylsulfatase
MAERVKPFPHIFEGREGCEGYLNFKVAALPEILQDNGYFTDMSGQWQVTLSVYRSKAPDIVSWGISGLKGAHETIRQLGMTKEVSPYACGFTKVLSWLLGSSNHYKHETQMYDNSNEKPRAYFNGKEIWMQDGEFINGSKDLP